MFISAQSVHICHSQLWMGGEGIGMEWKCPDSPTQKLFYVMYRLLSDALWLGLSPTWIQFFLASQMLRENLILQY